MSKLLELLRDLNNNNTKIIDTNKYYIKFISITNDSIKSLIQTVGNDTSVANANIYEVDIIHGSSLNENDGGMKTSLDLMNANDSYIKCCNEHLEYISNSYANIGRSTFSNSSDRYIYGEIGLILLVICLWLLSIMACMDKYNKLKTLQPQPNDYLPMNIDEIQVIKNEQDTVIYKKKKSTVSAPSHSHPYRVDSDDSLFLKQEINQIYSQNNQKIRIVSHSTSEPCLYRHLSYNSTTRSSNVYLLNEQKLQNNNASSHTVQSNRSHYYYNNNRGVSCDEYSSTGGDGNGDTTYKRSLFASSKRKNRLILDYKKLFERRQLQRSSCNSQDSKTTPAYAFVSINESVNQDQNLLNPNWIPLTVKKRLLSLHYRSRINLSKSESNLKTTVLKDKKLLSLQNSHEKQ